MGAEPSSETEGPAPQAEAVHLVRDDFLCNHLPIVYQISEQEQGEPPGS